MQNLNEFGAENLAKNIELMDLTYDPDAASARARVKKL